MCNDFRNRIEEKNKKIYKMKMLLIKLFGLLSVIDEFEDISLVEIAYSKLKTFIEEDCDCSM